MGISLKLKSDFRDYYDFWFDHDGAEFRRMTTDGPSRRGMFAMFDEAELDTPYHGCVEDSLDRNVVVYLDETAHRGDGKVLLSIDDARRDYNDYYCSGYIKSNSRSERRLVIGTRAFILEYKSDDEWRSNCGDVGISVKSTTDRDKLPYDFAFPMYAIDFVNGKAIDFNIAPGVGGTGIEHVMRGPEVVQSIKQWVKKCGIVLPSGTH